MISVEKEIRLVLLDYIVEEPHMRSMFEDWTGKEGSKKRWLARINQQFPHVGNIRTLFLKERAREMNNWGRRLRDDAPTWADYHQDRISRERGSANKSPPVSVTPSTVDVSISSNLSRSGGLSDQMQTTIDEVDQAVPAPTTTRHVMMSDVSEYRSESEQKQTSNEEDRKTPSASSQPDTKRKAPSSTPSARDIPNTEYASDVTKKMKTQPSESCKLTPSQLAVTESNADRWKRVREWSNDEDIKSNIRPCNRFLKNSKTLERITYSACGNSEAITLPCKMITSFHHTDFGDVQVLMDLMYIDESKGQYPQPPQSESNLEYFRFQVDQDGQLLEHLPGVRVCYFHVITEVHPPITPLQCLVGRWFSSPHRSALAMDHNLRGWDAWHMVGKPKLTLRALVEGRRKLVNHPFFSKVVHYPPKRTITKALPRDLLAFLCRDECSELQCYEKPSLQTAMNDHQLKQMRLELEISALEQGDTDPRRAKLRQNWMKNMIELPTTAKPCVHNQLHQVPDHEPGLCVYPETIDEDGVAKDPQDRRLLQTEGRSLKLPHEVAKQLDTPWGKRITFVQIEWYEYCQMKHPIWFDQRPLSKEERKEHSTQIEASVDIINIGDQGWFTKLGHLLDQQHNPKGSDFFVEHRFQLYPLVPGTWIQTNDDLDSLKKYYQFYRTVDDRNIKGLSRFGTVNQPYYLLRWEVKRPEFALIQRNGDTTYTSVLYVPVPLWLLWQHRNHFVASENNIRKLYEWRYGMSDGTNPIQKQVDSLYSLMIDVAKMKPTRDPASGLEVAPTHTLEYLQMSGNYHSWIWRLEDAEDSLNYCHDSHRGWLDRKAVEHKATQKNRSFVHEHDDELEIAEKRMERRKELQEERAILLDQRRLLDYKPHFTT